jgi:predicted nucleic acid-binding protein
MTAVEVTSAVARRREGGTLSAARASSILSRFRRHLAGRYPPVEITPALINDAMKLANTHGLRAYDAVQLAAALDLHEDWAATGLGAFVFVFADRDLNAAATGEGLTAEDPNFHPGPPRRPNPSVCKGQHQLLGFSQAGSRLWEREVKQYQ